MLQMQKLGYTNIDALEPSPEMLDRARARNVYINMIQDFLSADPLDVPDSMYENEVFKPIFFQ